MNISNYEIDMYISNNRIKNKYSLISKDIDFIYKPSVFLKVFVNPENPELVELYKSHIEKHNEKMATEEYFDSGFDVFVPQKVEFKLDEGCKSKMINMEIKCEMINFQSNDKEEIYDNTVTHTVTPSPFFSFPRSSISKTPLMLANHTGIIDCGYRGNLIGAFRCLDSLSYTVEKHTRLLQICHPSLCRIFVFMVDDENDLSTTLRGDGGFGSTGV
jgi:dUTP pyrophosphatase